MCLIIDNLQEYRDWLEHWMYAELPCYDMSVDIKHIELLVYVLLIPTVILLHAFVLCGLLTALFTNIALAPLGKLLNTIKSFIS